MMRMGNYPESCDWKMLSSDAGSIACTFCSVPDEFGGNVTERPSTFCGGVSLLGLLQLPFHHFLHSPWEIRELSVNVILIVIRGNASGAKQRPGRLFCYHQQALS